MRGRKMIMLNPQGLSLAGPDKDWHASAINPQLSWHSWDHISD